jgi:hypothetical protein
MELISTDLSLYIDRDYSVLESPYVRSVVMILGWDTYTFNLGDPDNEITYEMLSDNMYEDILEGLIGADHSDDGSYHLLIYTIVRWLYPQRKVGIFVDDKGDINLYYLNIGWERMSKDYTPICTGEELLERIYYISSHDHTPALTYEEVIERVPESKDFIDDMINGGDIPFITHGMRLDSEEEHWLLLSVLLIINRNTYIIILENLPPSSCKVSKERYMDYDIDINFFFQ